MQREELEGIGFLDLVALCGTVATDPFIETTKREKAAALRIDWVNLQRLPSSVLRDDHEREAEWESLRHRMIDLLATVLPDVA
jgi:hypothetical protein